MTPDQQRVEEIPGQEPDFSKWRLPCPSGHSAHGLSESEITMLGTAYRLGLREGRRQMREEAISVIESVPYYGALPEWRVIVDAIRSLPLSGDGKEGV